MSSDIYRLATGYGHSFKDGGLWLYMPYKTGLVPKVFSFFGKPRYGVLSATDKTSRVHPMDHTTVVTIQDDNIVTIESRHARRQSTCPKTILTISKMEDRELNDVLFREWLVRGLKSNGFEGKWEPVPKAGLQTMMDWLRQRGQDYAVIAGSAVLVGVLSQSVEFLVSALLLVILSVPLMGFLIPHLRLKRLTGTEQLVYRKKSPYIDKSR